MPGGAERSYFSAYGEQDMEISGVSGSSVSGSLHTRTSTRLDVGTTEKTEKSREAEHKHRNHGHRRNHHHHGHKGRALGVFRQELKQTLFASFRATFAVSQSGYSRIDGQASPDAVAADTLGAAQRIAAEEPVAASKSVIKFRQRVEEAASYTREVVGNDDDIADVEGTVGRVLDGLDKLERESERNVQSTASVLDVETKLRQTSRIKIRTQEGDIVKLNLRQATNLSATDVAATSEEATTATTQVRLANNSHFILRVEGNLNEAELGAIQNVFSQAESIANEFFGGDLFKALDLASALEYDSDQLARVNMRFKSVYMSTARMTMTDLPAAGPVERTTGLEAVPEIAAQAPKTAPEPDVVPAGPAVSTPVDDPAKSAQAPIIEAPVEVTETAQRVPDSTALSAFFDLVSSFLRSVSEGFEAGTDGNVTTAKLHFSQSFKLEILKSAMEVAAPAESTDDVVLATSLIDSMAGGDESEVVTET